MHFQRGFRMREVQSQKNNRRFKTPRKEVQKIFSEINRPITCVKLVLGGFVGLLATTSGKRFTGDLFLTKEKYHEQTHFFHDRRIVPF